uniref:Uncharacterized protein n=1 Tax=Arundo donax TaxID=35708 RepID=A0A0A8ZGM5_ARUDO
MIEPASTLACLTNNQQVHERLKHQNGIHQVKFSHFIGNVQELLVDW